MSSNYVTLNATQASLISSVGLTGDVIIPSTVDIEGTIYAVVSIGNNAFMDNVALTSITIPNTVTSIGNTVFLSCFDLTTVTFSPTATLLTIGSDAFDHCTSLNNITLPESLTTIGATAFYFCTGLTSITIPNSVTSMGRGVFNRCATLETAVLGSGLTEVPAYTFAGGCTALISVTIPLGVTLIDIDAFNGCTALATVYFQQTSALPNINATAFPTSPKPQTAYYKMGVTSPTVGTTAAEYLEEYFVTAIEEAPPPVICFKEDSTVLCLKDEKEVYVPIQNIRRGDLVKTFCSGFVPVNMIGTSKV
jgi:hypothetical protein